jgi:sugar fermentation stimulation protein A
MIIFNIIQGRFVERPNRFTVIFKAGETMEKAHLRDPGRLKEILIPGVHLLLRPALHPEGRKTKYDVVAVLKDNFWVLINSGFHSDLAQDLIESGFVEEFACYKVDRREYTYNKSRIDFLLSNSENSNNNEKMLVEVKGCTLVENGLARFPDAPTTRGKRHVEELTRALGEGFESAVLFLVLSEDAVRFTPNRVTDPKFSDALEFAHRRGVTVIPYVFENLYNDVKNELEVRPLRRIELNF